MAPAVFSAPAALAPAGFRKPKKYRSKFTRDLWDSTWSYIVKTRQPRFRRFDRGSCGKHKTHGPRRALTPTSFSESTLGGKP